MEVGVDMGQELDGQWVDLGRVGDEADWERVVVRNVE